MFNNSRGATLSNWYLYLIVIGITMPSLNLLDISQMPNITDVRMDRMMEVKFYKWKSLIIYLVEMSKSWKGCVIFIMKNLVLIR